VIREKIPGKLSKEISFSMTMIIHLMAVLMKATLATVGWEIMKQQSPQ
jgi:hypothetical protein